MVRQRPARYPGGRTRLRQEQNPDAHEDVEYVSNTKCGVRDGLLEAKKGTSVPWRINQ
jgi:hypothetical protein